MSSSRSAAGAGWLRIARRPDIVRRSLKVGLIVGTILVMINQGDAILTGSVTGTQVIKILLTYCVPYAVSTYASVASVRANDP